MASTTSPPSAGNTGASPAASGALSDVISPAVKAVAPFALAFTVYLGAFLIMSPNTTGDEPHYLLAAQSLIRDGDLNLRNDYASRERTLKVWSAFPLFPHAYDYRHNGQLRTAHGVGLSVLVAPAFAVGGITGVRLLLIAVAALLADQLYRLLRDLRIPFRWRFLSWVAVSFCLPVLVYSNQVYPEIPGALLLVVLLRLMVSRTRAPAALALGSSAAAALVWLHVRYLPLSLAGIAGLVYSSLVRSRGSTGSRAAVAAVSVPYLVGLGGLALAFQYWYGSPDPRAPLSAEPNPQRIGSAGWSFVYDRVVPDVFQPVLGWLPYAPVQWLGLAALGCVVIRFGWPALAVILVAAGYELIVASTGIPIGDSFPARYLVIVIPLIVVPLAVVLQHVRLVRVPFVPLLAVSFLVAAAAVFSSTWLYPRFLEPKNDTIRAVADAFPYVSLGQFPTSFVQAPGQPGFRPFTGTMRNGAAIAAAPRDPPGYILWGPYSGLRKGTYRATFSLAARGAGHREPVATLDVMGSPGGVILARRVLTADAFRRGGARTVSLRFHTNGLYLIESHVFYDGHGTLVVRPATVIPAGRVVSAHDFRGWPLAGIWVGGTIAAGVLLSLAMISAERRHGRATSSRGGGTAGSPRDPSRRTTARAQGP